MKIREIISEGGWASAKTQETIVTPSLLKKVVEYLSKDLEPRINQYFQDRGIPQIRFGRPVGSGSYYKKHLETTPDKRYGDIDIQFIVQELPGKGKSEIQTLYQSAVKQFGDASGAYETENGKNIVFEISRDQWVQVDLVMIFEQFVDWNDIFTPPEGVKGVLSASLYSALAEALNISISDVGIQAKLINGSIVPFSKQKGVELVTISTSKSNWAVDIAKYLGARELDPVLQRYPGMAQESSIEQVVGSIIGLARTLELNGRLAASGNSYAGAADLLRRIQEIYLNKIQKVVNSTKFEKAASPEAQQLAQETKQLLSSKGQAIAALLTQTLTENIGKKLARLGVAGAVALGGLQLGKTIPIAGSSFKPPTLNFQTSDDTVSTPSYDNRDPIVKSLETMEGNDAMHLLVDVAVMAGLKGLELAQFMAQMHHETGGFAKLVEMGNERTITRKYDIRHNPELARILGNTRPGDGWRFRGRGYIQLTGRANYTKASEDLFGDDRLLRDPDLAAIPEIAANIAVWYWKSRVQPNVSNYANTAQATRPINPNLRGLAERRRLFNFYAMTQI